MGTVFAARGLKLPIMSRNFNENAGATLETPAEPLSSAAAEIQSKRGSALKSKLSGGIFFGVSMAGIATLAWLALRLAGTRIYQVDECTNVFVIELLRAGRATVGTDLFEVFLSWMT